VEVLSGCILILVVADLRLLSGLPEDDEAVQLARLAEASGNSLESILQFQYNSMSCRAIEDSAIQDSDPYQDVRR